MVRVGKTKFGNIFYDINLEVDAFLPHTKGASEINVSTSIDNNVPQVKPIVNTNNMKKEKNNAQFDGYNSKTSYSHMNSVDTEFKKINEQYPTIQKILSARHEITAVAKRNLAGYINK